MKTYLLRDPKAVELQKLSWPSSPGNRLILATAAGEQG